MNAEPRLTDAMLEAALARRAARVHGEGLHDEVTALVVATRQDRRPLVTWPTWPVQQAHPLRVVALLAVIGVLFALLAGGMLIGGRPGEPVQRHPAALEPTGLERATTGVSALSGAVTDPDGTVWAAGDGVLVRLSSAMERIQTWTVADDAAFADIATIVAARGGGAWIVGHPGGRQTLRWFDGERFRDVIAAPPQGVSALAEAPDGSLWAGADQGLAHWDGKTWSSAPAGRLAHGVSALAVEPGGAVWVGDCESVETLSGTKECQLIGLSRLDGTRWETFEERPQGVVHGQPSIAVAPDGSVWVASNDRLARYDGHAWIPVIAHAPETGDALRPASVAFATDGTAWVSGCNFYGLLPARVLASRFDGSSWVVYNSADGLPITWCARLAVAPQGVFAATDEGLYRLADDRWERVWP